MSQHTIDLTHVRTRIQDALAAAAEQDAAAAANARQRADQLLAEAEVAAAERMLEAAELEFSSARRQQVILQQELGQVRVGVFETERAERGDSCGVIKSAVGKCGALCWCALCK